MRAEHERDAPSAQSATHQVAVLGCGAWGKNLVRNFAQLGALGAVCDEKEEARRACAEFHAECEVFSSAPRLLASERFGGVVIATPAETHGSLVREALLAGKDVFVEKPLCLSVTEAQSLVELAREREKILMVGHVLEYHPAVLELRRLVTEGALGQVRYIYSNRLSLGKVRREENILWSFAPHDVAVILRLLGAVPARVAASGGAYLQSEIADMTVTHLDFESGVRAHIFVSWLHPFKEQRLVVIGSNKMASFDDVGKQLVLYDQRIDWHEGLPVPVRGPGELVPFAADEPLRCECQAFLRAMATREPPLTDGESALRVLKVLRAAQDSLAAGGQPMALEMLAVQ